MYSTSQHLSGTIAVLIRVLEECTVGCSTAISASLKSRYGFYKYTVRQVNLVLIDYDSAQVSHLAVFSYRPYGPVEVAEAACGYLTSLYLTESEWRLVIDFGVKHKDLPSQPKKLGRVTVEGFLQYVI